MLCCATASSIVRYCVVLECIAQYCIQFPGFDLMLLFLIVASCRACDCIAYCIGFLYMVLLCVVMCCVVCLCFLVCVVFCRIRLDCIVRSGFVLDCIAWSCLILNCVGLDGVGVGLCRMVLY